jgi:hypothetical protein
MMLEVAAKAIREEKEIGMFIRRKEVKFSLLLDDMIIMLKWLVECVVSNIAMFRGVTLGGLFGHDGSYLVNGLIHLWVHNLMGYWEVLEN